MRVRSFGAVWLLRVYLGARRAGAGRPMATGLFPGWPASSQVFPLHAAPEQAAAAGAGAAAGLAAGALTLTGIGGFSHVASAVAVL